MGGNRASVGDAGGGFGGRDRGGLSLEVEKKKKEQKHRVAGEGGFEDRRGGQYSTAQKEGKCIRILGGNRKGEKKNEWERL